MGKHSLKRFFGCSKKAKYTCYDAGEQVIRRRGLSHVYPYACEFCSSWHIGHAKLVYFGA